MDSYICGPCRSFCFFGILLPKNKEFVECIMMFMDHPDEIIETKKYNENLSLHVCFDDQGLILFKVANRSR